MASTNGQKHEFQVFLSIAPREPLATALPLLILLWVNIHEIQRPQKMHYCATFGKYTIEYQPISQHQSNHSTAPKKVTKPAIFGRECPG